MSRSAALPPLFNCLIRTHHITSRKKVQRLKQAAIHSNVDWVLLRSGGSPGIMFAESRDEAGLHNWVAAVQSLRYKDYRCVRRPTLADPWCALQAHGFEETASVAEFAAEMDKRGLAAWWRKAMEYDTDG